MRENREYVRMSAPVVIKYNLKGVITTFKKAVGEDISENGMKFNCDTELNKGIELSMHIELPFDSMPIFTSAKVCWSEKDYNTQRCICGVHFLDISEIDKLRIRHYIDHTLKKK